MHNSTLTVHDTRSSTSFGNCLRGTNTHRIQPGITSLLAFIILFIATPIVTAQDVATDSTRERAGDFTTISVNHPGDLFDEWWLYLRRGNVLHCNRTDISLMGESLLVRGTLKSISIPRTEVASIVGKGSSYPFLKGMLLGSYLGSVFFLSPRGSPAFYAGKTENGNALGLNLLGALLTASAGTVTGVVRTLTAPPPANVTLTGTESYGIWYYLLTKRKPRLHIRGVAAWTFETGGRDWKEYLDASGGKDPAFDTGDEERVSPVNLLRSASITYSFTERIEAGVLLQTGGAPRFSREFIYYPTGTPPVADYIEAGGTYSTTGILFTALYHLLPIVPRAFSIHLGAGAGVGMVRTRTDPGAYSDPDPYSSATPRVDRTNERFVLNVSAGIEYFIDEALSVGLHGDYALYGGYDLPAQVIRDSDAVDRVRLPGTKLNLDSYGAGLLIGWHF